jgi:hypothetical protein
MPATWILPSRTSHSGVLTMAGSPPLETHATPNADKIVAAASEVVSG